MRSLSKFLLLTSAIASVNTAAYALTDITANTNADPIADDVIFQGDYLLRLNTGSSNAPWVFFNYDISTSTDGEGKIDYLNRGTSTFFQYNKIGDAGLALNEIVINGNNWETSAEEADIYAKTIDIGEGWSSQGTLTLSNGGDATVNTLDLNKAYVTVGDQSVLSFDDINAYNVDTPFHFLYNNNSSLFLKDGAVLGTGNKNINIINSISSAYTFTIKADNSQTFGNISATGDYTTDINITDYSTPDADAKLTFNNVILNHSDGSYLDINVDTIDAQFHVIGQEGKYLDELNATNGATITLKDNLEGDGSDLRAKSYLSNVSVDENASAFVIDGAKVEIAGNLNTTTLNLEGQQNRIDFTTTTTTDPLLDIEVGDIKETKSDKSFSMITIEKDTDLNNITFNDSTLGDPSLESKLVITNKQSSELNLNIAKISDLDSSIDGSAFGAMGNLNVTISQLGDDTFNRFGELSATDGSNIPDATAPELLLPGAKINLINNSFVNRLNFYDNGSLNINKTTVDSNESFSFTNNAVLNTTIYSDSDYGKIISDATETSIVDASTIINVDVTGDMDTISHGALFTIIDSLDSNAANVTIEDLTNEINDNSSLFNFVQVSDSSDLILKAKYVAYAGEGGSVAGGALDTIVSGGQADDTLIEIATKITDLSGDAKKVAQSQLEPETNGASVQTVSTSLDKVKGKVFDRLSQKMESPYRGVQVSSLNATSMYDMLAEKVDKGLKDFDTLLVADDNFEQNAQLGIYGDMPQAYNKYGIWGDFIYGDVNQKERKGFDGYNADYYGMIFGADKALDATTIAGLAVSYINTTSDGADNSKGDSSDVDTYSITAYGSKDLEDNVKLKGQFSYGYSKHKTVRDVVGVNVIGEHHSNIFETSFDASKHYTFDLNDYNIALEPNVGLSYYYLTSSSYDESAGGLSIKGKNYNSLNSDLGVKAILESIYEENDTIVLPTVKVNWNHEFLAENYDTTASYVGTSNTFIAEGISADRDTYSVGLGADTKVGDDLSFTFSYDVDLKDEYVGQKLSLKFRQEF